MSFSSLVILPYLHSYFRKEKMGSPHTKCAMMYLRSFFYFCRGNALRQGSAWRGSRASAALLLVTVSVFGVALWLYMTFLDSDVTETLVSQAEFVSPQPRVYTIQCSEDYDNYKRYPGEVALSCKALDSY